MNWAVKLEAESSQKFQIKTTFFASLRQDISYSLPPYFIPTPMHTHVHTHTEHETSVLVSRRSPNSVQGLSDAHK